MILPKNTKTLAKQSVPGFSFRRPGHRTSFPAVCRHCLNVLCSNVAVNQFMCTEHIRYTLFCFLKYNIYTKYELGRQSLKELFSRPGSFNLNMLSESPSFYHRSHSPRYGPKRPMAYFKKRVSCKVCVVCNHMFVYSHILIQGPSQQQFTKK